MFKKVSLGQLRKISLPTQSTEPEADHLAALRNTLAVHKDMGDQHRLVVPESIASLIPSDKPAKADKPA